MFLTSRRDADGETEIMAFHGRCDIFPVEIKADWDDANAVCDRYGAPKGMSLTGRITWLLTGRKVLTKGAN
ncbi:MAG: hypothetical protein J6V90_08195 [Treponema sp.]|nr:hypothetical protein [Treponema sp.]